MAQTFENGEGLNSIRGKLNANAVQINALQSDANLYVDTVQELLANTSLTYTDVPVGAFIVARSEGSAYQVAAPSASDQHLTTAGGVKVFVTSRPVVPEMLGEIGGGANDDAVMNIFFSIMAAGIPVKARGVYRLSATVLKTATGNIETDFVGATFTCVSGTHRAHMMFIEMANFGCTGKFGTWDADQKSQKCVEIRNSSTGKPDLRLVGEFLNPRLITPGNPGSTGLFIAGAFDVLEVSPTIKDVTRAAGSGTFGAQGCQAFVYTYLTSPDRNARVIRVVNPYIDGVTTDDTVGSVAAVDCDGVVVFQLEEQGQSCVVSDGVFINCQGRDTKMAARNPQIIRPRSSRSIAGITGGAVHHAMLYGDGSVRDASISLTGPANSQGTTPVSFYTAVASPNGYGPKIVDGLTISDTSTGAGELIEAAVDLSIANGLIADYGIHRAAISNIVVNGKSIKNVAIVNNFGGSTGAGHLDAKNIRANITTAFALCDSEMPAITCVMQSVQNTGSTIPVIRRADGAGMGNVFGVWRDGGGNIGIAANLGVDSPSSPGLMPLLAMVKSGLPSSFCGEFELYSNLAMPDNSTEAFSVGYPVGGAIVTIRVGVWSLVLQTDAGSNAFTSIGSTGAGWAEIDNTGTEPTTPGRFRVWKTSSGTAISIKNAIGAAMTVSVSARI